MNDFTLNCEPVSNNSHPSHKWCLQYPKSALLTQSVYTLLVHNMGRRFTVEDVAVLKHCSYLSAYRACRKLVKLGVARKTIVTWPLADQRGQERTMHRVGIEFKQWHSEPINARECEEFALSQ